MKLTKSQRHTAYILMLDDFQEQAFALNLCSIWYNWFDHDDSWKQMRYILPEIFNKRTNEWPGIMSNWFNNYSERIEALEKCIRETY